MAKVLIESMNCSGLRDKEKRLDIFHKAQEDHINILCLQETHLKTEDLKNINDDWNANHFVSGKDTNAGGGGGGGEGYDSYRRQF